ncbi:FxSxx-COOH system tetratricopeptide repeat protein [Streptomyces phaeochromogenes]|uniref:FxSxx-COOH system tetratricopeptide repeat protein n=1 Tax=Streptomyces phaeochromogenes TaxID=1923 RepID=UPI0034112163
MTRSSPEPAPDSPDGEDGPASKQRLPAWTELADALYLAAYQDSVRISSVPGLIAQEQGERSRQEGRSPDEQTPSDGRDSHRSHAPPSAGEDPSADDPATLRVIPAGRRARLGLMGPLGSGEEAERSGWPAAPRLADAVGLGRSLRPLRLTRDSPHEVELDEEATAERAAMAGVWTPVCRSLPERQLDLLLLVDVSPSMDLWSHTTRQIAELMEQTAAFRRVRVVPWDLDDSETAVPAAVVHSSNHLLLVVTDGGHSAWRTGGAASALHRLGSSSSLGVLSLLPQQLWDLTLPTVSRCRLRGRSPAAPNRAYDVDWKHPHTDPLGRPRTGPEPVRKNAIPVPVIELRSTALGRWAHLVASTGSEWHELAALWTAPDEDLRSATVGPVAEDLADLVTEPQGKDAEGGVSSAEPSLMQRAERAAAVVRRFRATASPAAYALALRLAAAPLNLPVMRLVQQSVPEAQFWNLSEIMLLGLVHRVDDTAGVEDAHRVSFDFEEGVREELLALGSRAETIRVLRQIQRHLGPQLEALWGEGGGALVAPEGSVVDPPLTEHTRPFVAHLYTALCAVSGPYLERAGHLGRLLQRNGPPSKGQSRTRGRPTSEHRQSSRYLAPEIRSNLNKAPKGALDSEPPAPQTPTAVNTRHSAGSSSTPTSYAADSPTPRPPRQGGTPVSAGSPVASGPHDPPRIWGNVPQRNRNFTGRETLLEVLRERLRGGVAAVLPEALHGMGGVGKSQIAIEYVYRHSREYRLIWWVPSEQESQIVQSLIELGEQMGLQVGPGMSAVPAVLDALRRGQPYQDWLLVFDNAEDPQTVRKYFPNNGPGSIVVTSRNSQWSTNFRSLEVDVFTREESVALLRRRSDNLPDGAVDAIAAKLGDLPLAVEQAAVWLAETGMPVQQYLDVYERNFTELMQFAPPSDYNRSVAAAWNVSLGRLRETRPDALQLLQVCAFFAPEPIEWDLFSAVRGVSVPPELQSTLADPVKLGRAVREIGRYALARIDHRQNTVLMHRLVQRVLIEQMDPREQAMMQHAAHQLLSHADPRNPQRSMFWPRYSSLLSHLRASDAVRCDDGWTRQLVLNEVRFLRARGDHSGALALGEEAAAIWRESRGEDHEEVLAIDQQIAETLREQGTDLPRAYALQSGLVERYGRVLGEGHEDTQRAQSYLAIHHRNRGQFEEARRMDRHVFEASKREFGSDDPATLLAAHNYGVSLRLAGNSEQALELDYDTWQRRIEVLGEDHIHTLGTREAYLLDLQEVGRYAEALDGYTTLAGEVTGRLGEQHRFVALVYRNWCVTLRKMGNHEDAYELSTRYLPVIGDSLGTDSRHYLLLAVSHANDLRQVGKLRESRTLSEQMLEKNRARYGQEHPHSYAIAMNLAVTLRLLGECEEAFELDQESVAGLTLLHGSGHPRSLLARMNLASDHFALGRPEEAHAIDVAVAEELGRQRENHPANLAVRLNLSYDLKALGRTEESNQLYSRALSKYRQVLGASHPATLDAERGLRANSDIDMLSL